MQRTLRLDRAIHQHRIRDVAERTRSDVQSRQRPGESSSGLCSWTGREHGVARAPESARRRGMSTTDQRRPYKSNSSPGSKSASIAASCTRPSSGLRTAGAGDAARLIGTARGETCGMNTHRPIDDLKVTAAKQRALRERLQAETLERESRLSGSSVVLRVRQAMKRPRV